MRTSVRRTLLCSRSHSHARGRYPHCLAMLDLLVNNPAFRKVRGWDEGSLLFSLGTVAGTSVIYAVVVVLHALVTCEDYDRLRGRADHASCMSADICEVVLYSGSQGLESNVFNTRFRSKNRCTIVLDIRKVSVVSDLEGGSVVRPETRKMVVS